MSDDEVWEDDDHQSKSSVIDDCDISESEDITTLNYNGGSRVEILVTWIIAFLAALQRKHLIPDSAIGALLKFLGTIFKVLSPLSTEITQLSRAFPSSFHMMLKFAAVKKDDFLTFVVCPNCTLYHYEDCIEGSGIHRESKHCSATVHGTKKCNSLLMKKVQSKR